MLCRLFAGTSEPRKGSKFDDIVESSSACRELLRLTVTELHMQPRSSVEKHRRGTRFGGKNQPAVSESLPGKFAEELNHCLVRESEGLVFLFYIELLLYGTGPYNVVSCPIYERQSECAFRDVRSDR